MKINFRIFFSRITFISRCIWFLRDYIFEKFSRKSCFVIFTFWLYTAHSRISKRFDQSSLFLLSSRFPDRTCSKNETKMRHFAWDSFKSKVITEASVFNDTIWPKNEQKSVIDSLIANESMKMNIEKWKPMEIKFKIEMSF